MGQLLRLPDRTGARQARDSRRNPARPRILLAYPAASRREYLAVFLASRGYAVTTCGDGRQALALVETGAFELVVTAIQMPHLDGLELITALRRQGGPAAIAVADGTGKMDRIYLRNATLCGAVATHDFSQAGRALLDSVDWLLRGRDDVIRDVVW
jgi:CheY-like chemotaxis protein